MHTLLGTGDAGKMERAINEILRHQNAKTVAGASIRAGFRISTMASRAHSCALKLMGWSAEHPVMVKARE